MAASAPVHEPSRLARDRVWIDTFGVSACLVLAKLLGALKSVAFAHVFGSGPDLDRYLLAFLVPSFVADVFCGTLIPAVVPALVALEHREGPASAHALYSRLMHKSLRIACFASLGIAIIATLVSAFYRSSSFDLPTLNRLTFLMLPILPLSAAANLWRAALNARRKFLVPAITAAVTPVILIFAVWTLDGRGGSYLLAAASTVGCCVEPSILGFAAVRAGLSLAPVSRTQPGSSHTIGAQYTYLAANTGVAAANIFIGQSMAATLGPGSISLFNYGTKLAAALLAVGPSALGVTILPRFSELAARREWAELKKTLSGILLWTVAAGALASVVLIATSPQIVRFVFQRGAFHATDTDIVSKIQAYSLLQLPFMPGIAILFRLLSALRANHLALPFASAMLLVNVPLNYIFMQRAGVAGIALASSLSQAALFVALTVLAYSRKSQERVEAAA